MDDARRDPVVIVQYVDDCPNWRPVVGDVAGLGAELGGVTVRSERIESVEHAHRAGFRGSPTVLVDGVDLFADGAQAPGLACRLYTTPEGPRGRPSREMLRAALVRRWSLERDQPA